MRRSTRTPKNLRALCLLPALLLSLTTLAVKAQDARAQRRAESIALLAETADRAREIEDLFYRARVQSLAGDALWPYDAERARAVFRRAWEAADASDKAEQEADRAETGLAADPDAAQFTESRREVIRRAAARDSVLADALLKEMRDEKEEAAAGNRRPSGPWRELSAAGARRLALATELLNQGEAEKAYRLAAPLVEEGVSAALVQFILRLHERQAVSAETLYRTLLERSRNEMRGQVNAVLLLSSPVISPDVLVVIDERGSVQYRPLPRSASEKAVAPLPFSRESRERFYRFAARVLLRPLATGGDAASRQREAAALYFAAGRLLPFFEREAAQYATELRARMSRLGEEVAAARRDAISGQMEVRSFSPEHRGDPLGPETEQLARAHDAATRDAVLLKLVSKAARQRLWERARRAAADIEDGQLKRAAQVFIVVQQIADLSRAFTEDKETNLASFTRFIRNADAPHFAKAWGLAQAALMAARLKKSGPEITELLNEAEHEADLTDEGRGTRQRVAAYLAVTTTAAEISPERAWQLLAETVKAVNQTEDYAGDEDTLDLQAGVSEEADEGGAESAERFSIETEVFRLDRIFATMARLDFDKALTSARDLKDEVPRAFATLAVARAGLEQKK